jgi:hypothetical protein
VGVTKYAGCGSALVWMIDHARLAAVSTPIATPSALIRTRGERPRVTASAPSSSSGQTR